MKEKIKSFKDNLKLVNNIVPPFPKSSIDSNIKPWMIISKNDQSQETQNLDAQPIDTESLLVLFDKQRQAISTLVEQLERLRAQNKKQRQIYQNSIQNLKDKLKQKEAHFHVYQAYAEAQIREYKEQVAQAEEKLKKREQLVLEVLENGDYQPPQIEEGEIEKVLDQCLYEEEKKNKNQLTFSQTELHLEQSLRSKTNYRTSSTTSNETEINKIFRISKGTKRANDLV